jgi:hypothetical protein
MTRLEKFHRYLLQTASIMILPPLHPKAVNRILTIAAVHLGLITKQGG